MSDFSTNWMLVVFYASVATGFFQIFMGAADRNKSKVWQGAVICVLYFYPVWEHAVKAVTS